MLAPEPKGMERRTWQKYRHDECDCENQLRCTKGDQDTDRKTIQYQAKQNIDSKRNQNQDNDVMRKQSAEQEKSLDHYPSA